MRILIAFAVLAACKGEAPKPSPAPIKTLVAKGFELARAQHEELVRSELGGAGAIVVIQADGRLELATGPASWDGTVPAKRSAIDLAALRARLVTPDDPVPPAPTPAPAERDDETQRARQQAIDQARKAGILGSTSSTVIVGSSSGWDESEDRSFGQLGTARASDLARAAKDVPLVLADGRAPAIELARVLETTGGVIGVSRTGDAAGVLDVAYARSELSDTEWNHAVLRQPWIEIHLDGSGLAVLALPAGEVHAVPWKAGAIDIDELRTKHAKIRISEAYSGFEPQVDLLVGAGATTQQLVETVVALYTVGARRVSIGEQRRPPADRAGEIASAPSRPSPQQPVVSIGDPNRQGDLDKEVIRKTIRTAMGQIQACYEKELLEDVRLAGKVTVKFFITPNGEVASSEGTGMNARIATCLAGVIKQLKFPKPAGGGGVSVTYPFVFKPAG